MILINLGQVVELHSDVISISGGADGLRDIGALESALASAFHSYGEMEFYPSVTSKIARIAYGIICNHPFVDGNKRTGMHVLEVLLKLNGIHVGFTQDDIVRIGIDLASGLMGCEQLDALIQERKR